MPLLETGRARLLDTYGLVLASGLVIPRVARLATALENGQQAGMFCIVHIRLEIIFCWLEFRKTDFVRTCRAWCLTNKNTSPGTRKIDGLRPYACFGAPARAFVKIVVVVV